MIGEKKEQWMELCEKAAIEQDDQKFYELISEISRLLKEKEDRFKGQPAPSRSSLLLQDKQRGVSRTVTKR
jgi:hypothetical protein